MNHAPQKNSPTETTKQSPAVSSQPDAEMELACIDLVCQLEHQLAVAREGYRDDQVGGPDVTSERMLKLLLDFSESHLQDQDMYKVNASMITATEKIAEHRKVVNSETWTRSFIRVFFDSVDENSVATHTELGKAMAQACATVFVVTINKLGAESDVAKQVEQSMEVFVEEFTENW